jgi:hypothetical protein
MRHEQPPTADVATGLSPGVAVRLVGAAFLAVAVVSALMWNLVGRPVPELPPAATTPEIAAPGGGGFADHSSAMPSSATASAGVGSRSSDPENSRALARRAGEAPPQPKLPVDPVPAAPAASAPIPPAPPAADVAAITPAEPKPEPAPTVSQVDAPGPAPAEGLRPDPQITTAPQTSPAPPTRAASPVSNPAPVLRTPRVTKAPPPAMREKPRHKAAQVHRPATVSKKAVRSDGPPVKAPLRVKPTARFAHAIEPRAAARLSRPARPSEARQRLASGPAAPRTPRVTLPAALRPQFLPMTGF